MDGVQLPQGQSHFEEAVRYILGISILVFQNLLAKLNMQNMQNYVQQRCRARQQHNLANSFYTDFILFERTRFCYYSEHTGIWEVGVRVDYPPPLPTNISTFTLQGPPRCNFKKKNLIICVKQCFGLINTKAQLFCKNKLTTSFF